MGGKWTKLLNEQGIGTNASRYAVTEDMLCLLLSWGETAELGDNYLWVHHYEEPFNIRVVVSRFECWMTDIVSRAGYPSKTQIPVWIPVPDTSTCLVMVYFGWYLLGTEYRYPALIMSDLNCFKLSWASIWEGKHIHASSKDLPCWRPSVTLHRSKCHKLIEFGAV